MANFLLAYRGGSMPETPEAQQQTMEAWGAWFGQLGSAVVDGGNPTSISKSVSAYGAVSDGAPSGITGYSVVAAESIDAAVAMAKGCPILAAGGSVDVYETFNVM